MKPLIPIIVTTGITLASLPLRASTPIHPLQPSAPRTVTVSESQTPPVIRAGLLQSTLIVLPAEEKVANVFAGDTVDWVFDGGHVASRFISVRRRQQTDRRTSTSSPTTGTSTRSNCVKSRMMPMRTTTPRC